MMSIEYIRQLAHEAGVYAEAMGQEPWVYHPSNTIGVPFPFPFLGDYVPEGWEMVEKHFVDKSGFGQEDEPALTLYAFVEIIEDRRETHPETGWAITEEGQFQVYVGEYRRTT